MEIFFFPVEFFQLHLPWHNEQQIFQFDTDQF